MKQKNIVDEVFDTFDDDKSSLISKFIKDNEKTKEIDAAEFYESLNEIGADDSEIEEIEKSITKLGYSLVSNEDDSIPDDKELEDIIASVKDTKSSLDSESQIRDSMNKYLKDIGKFKLLTAEEEIELASKAKKGDKVARDKLLNSNLRLVVKFAKQFNNRGLSFQDLINSGNLGLIRSVQTYDFTRGIRFSTYASTWIKQSIQRAIENKSKTIRIPVHMATRINKMKQAEKALVQEGILNPTSSQVAAKMAESGFIITERGVDSLRLYAQDIISLDTPTKEDEDSTTGDFIPDTSFETPDQFANTQHLHETLIKLMDETLTEKEKDILVKRYGLFDTKSMTLEEVKDIYGLSKERIRQIQAAALNKLRKKAKELRPFVENK